MLSTDGEPLLNLCKPLFTVVWCTIIQPTRTQMTTLFFHNGQSPPQFTPTHFLGEGANIRRTTIDTHGLVDTLDALTFDNVYHDGKRTLHTHTYQILHDPPVAQILDALQTRFGCTLRCTAYRFPNPTSGRHFTGTRHKTLMKLHLGEPIRYQLQQFHRSKPVGKRHAFTLQHEDLLVFNQQASGWNFKKTTHYSMRHAFERCHNGPPTFLVSNEVHMRRTDNIRQRQRKDCKRKRYNSPYAFKERVQRDLLIHLQDTELPPEFKRVKLQTFCDAVCKFMQKHCPQQWNTSKCIAEGYLASIEARYRETLKQTFLHNIHTAFGPPKEQCAIKIQAWVRGILTRTTLTT